MRLEDQVINLEISKKLKELGVKQDALFDWEIGTDNKPYVVEAVKERLGDEYRLYSAFTLAELGELLPIKTTSWKSDYWFCQVFAWDKAKIHREDDKTEADVRGKMLIYLLENGLLKGE